MKKETSFTIFVNPIIKTQINENLSVTGQFQVIVSKSNDPNYEFQYQYDIEPMDLIEIEMFGTKMDDNVDEAASFLKSNLNINVWDELIDDMEENIMCSGSIVDWVYDETGLGLPFNENKEVLDSINKGLGLQ
jgi:hypothetical protein